MLTNRMAFALSWMLTAWLLTAGWFIGTPLARGQATGGGACEIDMAMWVQSPQVIPAATAMVEDGIWQIAAVPGRQLLQVPVTIAASDQPVVLDASTLRVVGGRFIAWRLEVEPSAMFAIASDKEKSVSPSNSLAAPSLAGSAGGDGVSGGGGGGGPRMMRKLTRLPDGRWGWELDRAIPGATLKEQAEQMYVYKIKPDLLEKKLPPKPKMEPSPANETREAKLARIQKYQQEAEQYRIQEKAVGQLKLAAIRLPDRFVALASARAWAVLEVRAGFTDLVLEGPPPMPWKVNVPAWQVLRAIKPGENVPVVWQAIGELTREPAHPLNHRLAAQGLADGRLLTSVNRGDMVYQSAMAILRGPDISAKQILVTALGRDGDGSAVTLELATIASQSDEPSVLMALLKGLSVPGEGHAIGDSGVTSRTTSAEAIGGGIGGGGLGGLGGVVVRTAQRLISWPQTSVTMQAIDELIEISQKHPAWQQRLATQVSFSPLASSPKQASVAVHAVIQAARRNAPLALRWLDWQLLDPKSPVLAKLTLTELAQPGTGDAESTAGRGSVRLDSPSHHLLAWLDSSSTDMAALAWKSLEDFTLDDAPPFFPPSYPPSSPSSSPPSSPPAELRTNTGQSTLTLLLPKIMALAWKQKTLPPSLPVFLSRLPSSPWATAALLQVTAYGPDDLASSSAKLALERSASDHSLEPAMLLLNPADRQKMAARFYLWQKQPVPAATFLLLDRQARSPLTGWFARELTAGRLPSASAWVVPAGGESALLGLIWSADANLALGATSALVASAHGTDEQARELLTAIRQSGNQSPEYAKAQWMRLRQSLLMQKLSKADGYYRLIVRVWSSDSPESLASGLSSSGTGKEGGGGMAPHPSAQASKGPTMQASLGVVRLHADGQSVRLANQAINVSVPSEMLAIRIDRPVDLKNLNNAEIAKLPLDRLSGPIDLLPLDRGIWAGRIALPDGQMMQLLLEPVPP